MTPTGLEAMRYLRLFDAFLDYWWHYWWQQKNLSQIAPAKVFIWLFVQPCLQVALTANHLRLAQSIGLLDQHH